MTTNETVDDRVRTHAHKICLPLLITWTQKKKKEGKHILPSPSFVFTSKALGPRVVVPRCCLEVKTSFTALQSAASHSMSKRLASPYRNSLRTMGRRSNRLQRIHPCSSCSIRKLISTILRPSTRTGAGPLLTGVLGGVSVSGCKTAAPSASVTRRFGRLRQSRSLTELSFQTNSHVSNFSQVTEPKLETVDPDRRQPQPVEEAFDGP